MWLYLLDLNTILAAQFNTHWSRSNKYLGTLYSKELQYSTFDVMKACTRDFVVSRNFLILDMLRKWKNADLHTAVACGAMDRDSSSVTPMSFSVEEQYLKLIKTLVLNSF